MNKKSLLKWLVLALVLLTLAIIQFIPSEPVNTLGGTPPGEPSMSLDGSS